MTGRRSTLTAAELAEVARETGESIETVRELADALAACAEEDDIEEELSRPPMKVHGWAADRSGCWWYRLELPLRELARRGVIEVGGIAERLAPEVYGGETEPRIVIGQRVSKPGPTGLWQGMARAGRHTLVYEVDDDLLEITDPEANAAGFRFFSDKAIRDNVKRNIAAAHAVTVSTHHLGAVDWIRRYNENVYVLPNGIPSALLELDGAPQLADPVVVGWQGSATHGADWMDAAGYVDRAIRQARPETLLRIWGGREDWFARLRCQREHAPWQADMWTYYRSLRMDVALAPLRPSVFNRSKSPIRCMEAGALGIPVLASAAGPYEDYVHDGLTGYLVRRDHEWGTLLRHLIDRPHERAELGAAGREQAREQTIEGPVGDAWEKAYRELVDR